MFKCFLFIVFILYFKELHTFRLIFISYFYGFQALIIILVKLVIFFVLVKKACYNQMPRYVIFVVF